MKGMRIVAPLLALLLSACGDGSVQSPDFTSVLKGLDVQDRATASDVVSAAAGTTVQFDAIGQFSTPPGSDSDIKTDKTEASWESTDVNVATIDNNGLATAVAPGVATITATKGDFSATATLTVTAATVTSLTIIRTGDDTQTALTSDTIPRGGQRSYTAIATLTNGSKVINPITYWTSSTAAVQADSPVDPTPTKVFKALNSATVGDVSVIEASSPAAGNTTIRASLPVTVSGATLTGALTVRLNPASPIPINSSTQATAYGTYSDGTTSPISDTSIDWTPAPGTSPIATVAADGTVTTGQTQGTVDIVATLKANAEPQIVGAARSASTPLLVTGAVCTSPLLAPAQVSSSTSLLCIGCNLTQPDNLVDANPESYAQANITVGLLALSSISVDVNGTTTYQGGPNTNAGFIVGHPAGQLLSAELLSQVSLTTLFDGNPTVDSTDGTTNPLVVDLLGTTLIGASDQALVSVASTVPFNGLRLTYSGGLLTALSGLQIYSACGTTAPPAPPAP